MPLRDALTRVAALPARSARCASCRRARPRADREARLERGRVRAAAGGGGRLRGGGGRAEPLPRRRRGAAARGARGAPRRAGRAGGARQRRGRADPAVRAWPRSTPATRAAFPWPSFPSYVAAAACGGAEAARVPLRRARSRPRRGARGGPPRRAPKLRLPRQPEQPDRHAARSGRAAPLPRRAARPACCACSTRPTPSTPTPSPRDPRCCARGAGALCVLRTFSKVYGLAALRIGYALASPEVADALDRVRPIFNVNQPAQEAASPRWARSDAVALRVEHARRRARARSARLLAGAGPRSGALADELRVRRRAGRRRRGAGRAAARGRRGCIVRALRGFGAPGRDPRDRAAPTRRTPPSPRRSRA